MLHVQQHSWVTKLQKKNFYLEINGFFKIVFVLGVCVLNLLNFLNVQIADSRATTAAVR